jgi:hypothetical protein
VKENPIMNKMRHTFIAITAALTISLPGAASAAQFQKAEMAGYLLVSSDKVPDAYNAGFSLYAAAVGGSQADHRRKEGPDR